MPQMDEWQPISTALHKEGAKILGSDGQEIVTLEFGSLVARDRETGEATQWFDCAQRPFFPTIWKPLPPLP
jgi:hypothetical protein